MARVRRVRDQKDNVVGYSFHCAGCDSYHMFYTSEWTRRDGSKMKGWWFNGDMDRPTFRPSLLVYELKLEDTVLQPRCHSFVRDGQIQYLNDCGHALAGITQDLPEISEEP